MILKDEPKWLLKEAVIAFHRMVTADFGGSSGIRDPGLLDSALARPRNLLAYESNSTFFDLAASYAFGISKNHPFVDGNKRVSFLAAAVFLEINGFVLGADEAETAVVFEQIASGEMSEKALSSWLESNCSKAT